MQAQGEDSQWRATNRDDPRPIAVAYHDGVCEPGTKLQVDEVGPALRYAKAQITRTPRQGGGNFSGGGNSGGFGGQQAAPAQSAPQAAPDYSQGGYGAPAGGQADDPWGAPGNSQFDKEPPF